MFKVINGGKMPTRGSKYSACVDVYANEDVTIGAGETVVVGLGVAIDLDWDIIYPYAEKMPEAWGIDFLNSHYIQLMLRSSLGKKGLILPNGVGIIDLDYEDEIKMIIYNPSSQKVYTDSNGFITEIESNDGFKINKGDRIGQVTLLEHKSYLFGIESEEERAGGFGSTGEN